MFYVCNVHCAVHIMFDKISLIQVVCNLPRVFNNAAFLIYKLRTKLLLDYMLLLDWSYRLSCVLNVVWKKDRCSNYFVILC